MPQAKPDRAYVKRRHRGSPPARASPARPGPPAGPLCAAYKGGRKPCPKLALAPRGLPGWPSAEGLSPCGFSSAPSRRSLLREASRKKERKEGDYFPAAEGAQKLFGGSGRTGVGAGLGGARCSLLPSFPSPPPLCSPAALSLPSLSCSLLTVALPPFSPPARSGSFTE